MNFKFGTIMRYTKSKSVIRANEALNRKTKDKISVKSIRMNRKKCRFLLVQPKTQRRCVV